MSGKSELRLFDYNLPQIAIVDSYFVTVNPVTAIGGERSEIDFVIPASSKEYLDLNDTLLSIKVRMVRENGELFIGSTETYVTNYFMNSLFSDVKLQLNNIIIEGGNEYYPWKATIEDMFNFNGKTKEIQLAPKGYYTDIESFKDQFNNSGEVELCGALRLNFFAQPKYLPPGIDVRITMKRTDSNFSLCRNESDTAIFPKIVITKAKLYIRKAVVNPSVEYGHNLGLEKSNMIYCYNVGKIFRHQITTGSWDFIKDNVFSSTLLPKFVILGMISQAAYSGANKLADPFYFNHYHVRQVNMIVDGSSAPFRAGYDVNFKTGQIADVFMRSMIQGGTFFNKNLNNGITMKQFKEEGMTFFTFNLTADYNYYQTQFPKSIPVRLEMSFAEALPEPINVILYAIYDSRLEISQDRQIICTNHVL